MALVTVHLLMISNYFHDTSINMLDQCKYYVSKFQLNVFLLLWQMFNDIVLLQASGCLPNMLQHSITIKWSSTLKVIFSYGLGNKLLSYINGIQILCKLDISNKNGNVF